MPGALPQIMVFLAILAVTWIAPLVGGAFTESGPGSWYQTINRPSWTPPGSVIGSVWTVLYMLMAIAAFMVWRRSRATPALRPALPAAAAVYGVQLVLSGLWSVVFFGLRSPGLAVVNIVLLLAMIGVTMRVFRTFGRTPAMLLIPYAAWVAFATVLNVTIWRMN